MRDSTRTAQQTQSTSVIKTSQLTLVGIGLLPVKKIGGLRRFEAAVSNYGNEIAPSPTTFERGAFQFENNICSTTYIR